MSKDRSEYKKKYRQEHREHIAAYQREWEQRFKEEHGCCYKTYRKRKEAEQYQK